MASVPKVKKPLAGRDAQVALNLAETLAGQTTADLAVRKDFFVDLKVPASLTQGDKPRFSAQVHHKGIAGQAARCADRACQGRASQQTGERDVGRIYLVEKFKDDEVWFWGLGFEAQLDAKKRYGRTESRNDAMAALKAEYERWLKERK